MNQKENLNILLYGQSTYKNKGCEAIVVTTLEKIKKDIEGNVIVSTNDQNDKKKFTNLVTKYIKAYYKEEELEPEEKKKIDYYKSIKFDYMNFEKVYEKDVINAIDEVDICLSIGGDNYFYGEPNWIYTINRVAKEKNKKTVLWCASLFEEIKDSNMIRDLKTYDLIIVRETLSYNALVKFIEKDRLILEPDTAFSLEKEYVELPFEFNENKKYIGLNISPLISNYTKDSDSIKYSVNKLIDYLLMNNEYEILLIPHVYNENNNDLVALEEIKEDYKENERVRLLQEKEYNCKQLKYIISKCSFLVAARTHASIAGYSSLVPTLVIGYSVKSKGIALDLFGDYKDYVIPVNEINPEILLEKFKFLEDNEEKIKRKLNEKIPKYYEQASNLIKTMLKQLNKLNNKYVTQNYRCTGCMACYNICPVGAIRIVENEEGFKYTEIDDEKCIKCNKCKNTCPSNKDYKYIFSEIEGVAAKNLNLEERMKSSSGGIFSVLAKSILKNDGVVYGAKYDKKKVEHIRCENEEELDKIRGSKYIQSEIGYTYRKVEKDLRDNREVLFSGTPCQVEGLKKYLKSEYEKLITVSIVCHGVPSQRVFNEYIDEKEKEEKQEINYVNFRDKINGWKRYNVTYETERGNVSDCFQNDNYMKGFLKDYFLRQSCYYCDMKLKKKNTSDIILGDYWGIEIELPEMDDDKGTSIVIVNSEKGKKLVEKVKSEIDYTPTEIESCVRYNPMIITHPKYNNQRELFFELLKNNSYMLIINYLEEKEEREKLQKKYNLEIQRLQEKVEESTKQEILQREEKEAFKNELHKVYNSKRWRYVSKVAKIFNK